MSSKSSKSLLRTTEEAFIMPDDIKKCGYMKKLKTMKKKYFVLRDNNDSNSGNLSYYDSEKKFKNLNSQPKRVIYLKDCFSINRKIDGKHKYAIALYTKEDSFTTVLDDEQQLKDWLEALIDLKSQGIDSRIANYPHYEHVWQVIINRNGLGQTRNMNGVHRFCLTSNTLFIIKVDPQNDKPDVYEFPLISIRRCGHTFSTFFIELGRSSSIGPGELWIQAGDSAIAQNMHEVILQAMCSSKNNEEFGPSQRPRSASTSDKPISTRRPTQSSHSGQFGTSYSSTTSSSVLSTSATKTSSIRERCDSMPSRSRTNSDSDSAHDSRLWNMTPGHYQTSHMGSYHSRNLSSLGNSPPSLNLLGSTACSTDSAGSSLSIDDYESSHCLTPVSEHHSGLQHSLIPSEPPISEEDIQTDDYLSMSPTNSSIGNTSSVGVRSQLNLTFRPPSASNTSPITSPTFGSNKSTSQSIRDDVSPYMPMSPVGSVEAESISSSRRSSGFEKHMNTETQSSSEYMPMMSSQEIKSPTSEEYLNMAPLTQSLSESLANTKSLHPSREEFHLDKVKSYYPSDENDSFEYLPPVRAYSIGSKPQPVTKFGSKSKTSSKSGTQTPERDEEIRIRAFSMGSQANAREIRVAARKQQLIEEQIGAPAAPIKEIPRNSAKASSAPVLSPAQPRKRAATVGSRPIFSRPSATPDRSDTDLMEIDYSKSMQSKPVREKIEDKIKRMNIDRSVHRQRSNSRSSTSSSGFGSTTTTSPSITSSMSELTDKKRDISGTHSIHKSGDEHIHSASTRTLNSGRDSTNDILQVVTTGPATNEIKLPSNLRPNISQTTQHLPTVPSQHSSVCVQQNQSQKLPTIQTNITKTESFAQKSEENSTKTKFTEDKDGDYVCLDIRSTASVPQNTSQAVSHSLPKLNSKDSTLDEQPIDQNKYNFVPQKQNDIQIEDISPKMENSSETSIKSLVEKEGFVLNTESNPSKPIQLTVNQTLSKSKTMNTNMSPIFSNEKFDSFPTTTPTPTPTTTQTDNGSENVSLSSSSGSRPSSVSSNRELNYASLDLPPPAANDLTDEHKCSPKLLAKCIQPSFLMVNSLPAPTPVTPLISCCENQELVSSSGLKYAEIDFGIGDKKNAKS